MWNIPDRRGVAHAVREAIAAVYDAIDGDLRGGGEVNGSGEGNVDRLFQLGQILTKRAGKRRMRATRGSIFLLI